ncbi:MAG: alcohol dehydrogenase catalytic domain-containing protein, partial [Lachnospiraceae bacterium]|nr:alcohol dehydrogenase catalytic domain-containing protein [Lachnospiraceae bacterium]
MKFKKAVLVEPGRFEILEVEENPGRGQILVKVASCGLCNWELNFWQGKLGAGETEPLVLGHEWAGTVTALGEGVTDFQIGDKVACGIPEMEDF